MNTNPIGHSSTPPFGIHHEQGYSLVIICGLATTALALLGVYVLNVTADEHIMGLYANYIIPAGAILVGLVASSGYGLASWFSGIKITRQLLWIVLFAQVVAYFAAQYVEFSSLKLVHQDGKPVGFIEYFDLNARSFAWQQSDGSPGQPLGIWGYAFRGLEILGFVGGSLVVPLVMGKAPYCQSCRRYMRKHQLTSIGASVKTRRVKKSELASTAAYEAEQQQALETGRKTLNALTDFATNNRTAEFQKAIADCEQAKKESLKLPARFSVVLVHCKGCHDGWLVVNQVLRRGNQIRQTEVGRTQLHSEFVHAICT